MNRGAVLLASIAIVLASGPPRLVAEGENALGDDAVLRGMEEGLAFLRRGDQDRAKAAFDGALAGVEMLWADSESARRVRSKWYEEGAKTFRGEPYERASAYLYRGLIELLSGDSESARAYFKAGTLQDAFAEEEQYRCDFGLLFYLYALACLDVGAEDLANQALVEAASVAGRPWYFAKEPPRQRATVLVVETGRAPKKLADGRSHAELVYRRGEGFDDQTVEATCVGSDRRFFPSSSEDLFFQASTRGGREVERILEGKVVFRDRLEETGEGLRGAAAASGVAAAASGSAATGAVGAVADLIGGFSRLVAANAKARVDTRAWKSLPDRLHLIFVPPAEACSEITVTHLDSAEQPIPGLTRRIPAPFDRSAGLYSYVYVPSAGPGS